MIDESVESVSILQEGWPVDDVRRLLRIQIRELMSCFKYVDSRENWLINDTINTVHTFLNIPGFT